MATASLKELYLDELCDLYDAETQAILALSRLSEAIRHAELRAALMRQCAEARIHLERLELIFTHWGKKQVPHLCAGFAGIVQEADNRLNEPATAIAREASVIGAARRIAHYEIAAYGAARLYARWLNRFDDVRLIDETLEEEARADRRLTDIADARSTISAA